MFAFTDEAVRFISEVHVSRTIFLPAVVVAIGILAALPFRRTSSTPPQTMADASGQNRSDTSGEPVAEGQSMGVPFSVTPLNLERSTGPDDSVSLLEQMAPIAAGPRQPDQPKIESLPASYEEIAVPLAGRDAAKNLLRGGEKGNEPAKREAKANALTGSRWAFDRFGIPRPISEVQAGRIAQGADANDRFQWDAAEQASHEPSVWTDPQPLAKNSANELMLASQIHRASNEGNRAGNEGSGESQPRKSPGETFQPARASVKLRVSKDPSVAPEEVAGTEPDNREPQATVRQRYWIYEPKS